MSKSIHSERHRRLVDLLTEKRRAAGLTQAEVAKAMGRHQPFIANIENGERRVDIIELIDLEKIIGFDVHLLIDGLKKIASRASKRQAKISMKASSGRHNSGSNERSEGKLPPC